MEKGKSTKELPKDAKISTKDISPDSTKTGDQTEPPPESSPKGARPKQIRKKAHFDPKNIAATKTPGLDKIDEPPTPWPGARPEVSKVQQEVLAKKLEMLAMASKQIEQEKERGKVCENYAEEQRKAAFLRKKWEIYKDEGQQMAAQRNDENEHKEEKCSESSSESDSGVS